MIRAEKLSFKIGDFQLRRISLDIAQGEYFVLLGPPGSGKSIFLECVCGLKKVGSGKIYIDGHNVTDVEPRGRCIGYVPQDYALFPHLSVERNIAFGLHAHNYNRKTISHKVAQTAEMLDIGHLLTRSVYGLSGGEKQRAALARALVLQPKVLLLDEPVCALDEATRQNVCVQLRRVQRQLGLTTVHVSHNLEEAFSVADRAGILHKGTLQQFGSMGQLLRQPQNEFIVRFMRCDNLFSGQVVQPGPQPESTTIVQCGRVQLVVPGKHQGQIKFMIRPENVLLNKAEQTSRKKNNQLEVKLMRSRDCGNYVRVELKGPFELVAHLSHTEFAEVGAKPRSDLLAVLRPEDIHVLPQ